MAHTKAGVNADNVLKGANNANPNHNAPNAQLHIYSCRLQDHLNAWKNVPIPT